MRQYLPRTFRGWVGLLLILALAVIGFAVLLLYSTPHWYAPLDPTDKNVMDTAEHAQNVVLDLHNKLEELPLGERTWSITQDEINSYLAVSNHDATSPAALRSGQVTDPIVIFKPDEMTLAARVAGVPGGGTGGCWRRGDGRTARGRIAGIGKWRHAASNHTAQRHRGFAAHALFAGAPKNRGTGGHHQCRPFQIDRSGNCGPTAARSRRGRPLQISQTSGANQRSSDYRRKIDSGFEESPIDRREINAILNSAGLRPQHKFGQNFMVDQTTLARIADAGEVGPQDVVLEIGPGVGNLTRLLAQRAAAVLAVDIDAPLLNAARQHHKELTNITWLQEDVLAGKHKISPLVLETLHRLAPSQRDAFPAHLKLVSNLPYNVASPLVAELLVQMWLERNNPQGLLFERMAFTVQWEVAQRMIAQPNTRDYGPLGILIGLLADVEILRKIPPGAFWPPPKVHSALVRVLPQRKRFDAVPDVLGLQKMLSGVFAHRRQRISNALDHWLKETAPANLLYNLRTANIDATARPENLLPAHFVQLAKICNPKSPSSNIE